MHRVAVIDTVIDSRKLHCQRFESYNVCRRGGEALTGTGISHGTMVALVLDHCLENYELVSIQVLPDDSGRKGKTAGDIRDLEAALRLCTQLEVDVVNLSAVSSLLSDSKYLYDTAKRLSQKTVIVSALDNDRYVTVPASYPFVVGVQSDREQYLHPGELAYQEGERLGAQVYANCMFDFVQQAHYMPSNSLAAPVTAAFICRQLGCGMNLEQVIGQLKSYEREQYRKDELLLYISAEVPIILVYGEKECEIVKGACKAADQFFECYKVQATGISSVTMDYDIRFRKIGKLDDLEDELLFMNCHYKTDLIFVLVKKEEIDAARYKAAFDIEIELEGHSLEAIYEERCITADVEDIADTIYRILT